MRDLGRPIERETYELISKSLSHPIRRKILRILSEEKKKHFVELRDSLGIDGGHLTYHLNELGELLAKTEDGAYELSSLGKVSISLMRDIEETSRYARAKETVGRRDQLIWSIVTGVPIALLCFAVIDESVFVSIFGTLDSRLPLAIMAIALLVSWTYYTLMRLKGVKILQILKSRNTLLMQILFFAMSLSGVALYSLQTQDWKVFIGGLISTMIYFLVLRKLQLKEVERATFPEEKEESSESPEVKT